MKASIHFMLSPCSNNCLHATWYTLIELFQMVFRDTPPNPMSDFLAHLQTLFYPTPGILNQVKFQAITQPTLEQQDATLLLPFHG